MSARRSSWSIPHRQIVVLRCSIATGEAQVAHYTSSACPRTPEKIQLETGGFLLHLFLKTDTGLNHLADAVKTEKHRERTAMAIF
jgi:hypothetical protein